MQKLVPTIAIAPRQLVGMLSRKPKLPDPTAIVLEPLEAQPAYQAALAELTALENRLDQAREQRKRAIARALGAKPGRSAVERAKLLVSGGRVDPTNPADDRTAADVEEFEILRPAICEATAKLDEVCRDLNYEASLLFKPLHEQALVGIFRAVEELHAALAVDDAVIARLRALHYTPSSSVLANIVPIAAAAIGSPDAAFSSPSWYFRRELEERGLL
jgi:hypothetical protein